MGNRRRYRKKADQFVVAVELDLKTDGFTYRKWEVFAKTYRKISPGIYVKTTPIWAEVATEPGQVDTKEGVSHYQAGDYIVSNNEDGTDAYCISAAKFESMYEPDD